MKTQGRVRWNPKGFAFVIRDDDGPDIFVPPGKLKGAMEGDLVEVSFVHEPKGPRGKVITVLEQAAVSVSGTYRRLKRWGVLDPARPFPYPIVIPHGREGRAQNLDLVVATIDRHGRRKSTPAVSATVQHVIDIPEHIGDDLRMVVCKHGLPWTFPPTTQIEANKAASRDLHAEAGRRQDLRGRTLFTIDSASARDFDDAVGIERLPDGTFRLTVAIADVAHLVPEGSLLDQEAAQRGFSVYFPETSIPMLPEILSGGVLSLKPHKDRLALAVEMHLGPRAGLLSFSCCEAVIRSQARLTYDEVDTCLQNPAAAGHIQPAIIESLQSLDRIARHLRSRRMGGGALCFDMPEVEISLDEAGAVAAVSRRVRGPAEILIEEAMLLTNTVVCAFLEKQRQPVLYRVHEPPAQDDLAEFAWLMKKIGLDKDLLHELEHPNPKRVNRIFMRIARQNQGQPSERFVIQNLLRSMKQARYAHEDHGHFGLGRRGYLHFTSPIRRYSDLVIHRLVKEALNPTAKPARTSAKWKRYLRYAAPVISQLERKTDEAMYDVIRLKTAAFLATQLGEDFDGVITGIQPFGVFVELADYPADGMISTSQIQGATFRDDRSVRMKGRQLSLGDSVRVRLARVDVSRGLIDLTLI